MTDYVFDSVVALDPVTGFLAKDAVGLVYAEADVSETTPLTVKDSAGGAITSVQSGPVGVLETFITTDQTRVWWVSGGFKMLLTSYTSLLTAAQAAASSAADSSAAAIAAAAAAATAGLPAAAGASPGSVATLDADLRPVWLSPSSTGGSGSWVTLADKPTSFPPAQHTTLLDDLRKTGGTGGTTLAAKILQFLAAADETAARAVIKAAPDTVTSFPGFGSTNVLAMRGDRSFRSTEIALDPAAPISGLAAGNVHTALAELAARPSGSGGTAVLPFVYRNEAAGTYATRPTGLPAGTRVWWFGTVQPSFGGLYMQTGDLFIALAS